jgi:hypothetical protein
VFCLRHPCVVSNMPTVKQTHQGGGAISGRTS